MVDSNDNTIFYDPFDAMTFTYDNCFLCGKPLTDDRSNEHIFPKWILNKYNLWDTEIVLLNRTTIPYRNLTVPCCQSCNTEFLSPVENMISTHLQGGYSQFVQLERIRIYQWLVKIFYGLLFKELSLLVDRRDTKYGYITSPELLEQLKTLHVLLQSVRVPFQLEGSPPWSIFIVETHSYGDERDFDYHDHLATLTFSIRLSGIGIIACLEDNGAQEQIYSDYFDKFKGIKLHPIQFRELVAKVAYKAYLMNRTPKYITILPNEEGQRVTFVSLPIGGLSAKPIFDEWNQHKYAELLASIWQQYGIEFNDIYQEPDLVLSLVEKEDGKVNILDSDGNRVEDNGS